MKYEFWMATLYRLGNEKRRHVSEMTGGAKEFYHLSGRQLINLCLFTKEEISYIEKSREAFDIEGEWKKFLKGDIQFIPWKSDSYPERLLEISDAPYALFVKGNLPLEQKRSVAIVGARDCSEYGRSISRMIGKTMAEYDIQVISGMALGIDSASHAGALEAGGDTFAILGGGCDVCYPRTSINIYNNILSGNGGVLSEFLPGTQPQPKFFPMRNRIISALADILIVVEARERSGSLITADCALDQGKDVYAVPGRYLDPLSVGCNRLIEQGAGIFVDMNSFLKNTGIVNTAKKKKNPIGEISLSREAACVYNCIDLDVKHLDVITHESGLDLLTVLDALGTLKKYKLVQETFQNYFCRKL
ncbi:MAG: DNA-processing protein DprA [Lachnospiraceae bacterium]|nr:DNA-processing protein DprA [Lachnospiraceae bacterium]